MSNVQEIEQAIKALSSQDLQQLRAWFAEHDADKWDTQLEADAASGKLDSLGKEALEDLSNRKSTLL